MSTIATNILTAEEINELCNIETRHGFSLTKLNKLRERQIEEFLKQYNYLAAYPNIKPHYIRCQHHRKEPTKGVKINPYGTSLTLDECLQAIQQGYNIGILCNPEFDYCIYDKDGGTELITTIPTFTVTSRPDHSHFYYINSDVTHNRVISGVGELKTWGKYVLCAGSIKKSAEDYRFYQITDTSPLDILSNNKLPSRWQPRRTDTDAATPHLTGEEGKSSSLCSLSPVRSTALHYPQSFNPLKCVNDRGENLAECMVRCPSILEALKVPVNGVYKDKVVDDSEHDMLCLKYLVNQGFSDSDAVNILRYYRQRAKLFRSEIIEYYLAHAHWKPRLGNHSKIIMWGTV